MTIAPSRARRLVLIGCLCISLPSKGAETLLEKLLRISGLAAAPGELRTRTEYGTVGSLWVVDVAEAAPARWTTRSGFRSPVFSVTDETVYAIKDETLVRLSGPGAPPIVLHKVIGVKKLVGFDQQVPDDLVVLMDNLISPIASLSLITGLIRPLPFDENVAEHRRLLGQIRGQDRKSGSTSVFVEKQTKQGMTLEIEWTDIVVKQGGAKIRYLGQCDGTNCSQPALSRDARKVVFVRAES